jgi:hypothetical protein
MTGTRAPVNRNHYECIRTCGLERKDHESGTSGGMRVTRGTCIPGLSRGYSRSPQQDPLSLPKAEEFHPVPIFVA